MELSFWPEDFSPGAACVALALADIYDMQDDQDAHERLLQELLRTAWPSARAQRQ